MSLESTHQESHLPPDRRGSENCDRGVRNHRPWRWQSSGRASAKRFSYSRTVTGVDLKSIKINLKNIEKSTNIQQSQGDPKALRTLIMIRTLQGGMSPVDNGHLLWGPGTTATKHHTMPAFIQCCKASCPRSLDHRNNEALPLLHLLLESPDAISMAAMDLLYNKQSNETQIG